MSLKKGKNVLENVHLYYTMVNPKFPDTSFDKKVWKTSTLVTKEDVLALRKRYPIVKAFSKGVIANNTVESAEEFEEKFKCAPPYEAEEYYFIEFSTYAAYQDGSINEKNIVDVINIKGGKPVLQSVGNGTLGHIQWKERTFKHKGKEGLTLDLLRIGVVDLVPYENTASCEFDLEEDEGGDSFDDEESGLTESSTEEAVGEDEDDGDEW